MKLEINVKKKHLYLLVFLIAVFAGMILVIGFGTSTPSTFGHSVSEIDWNQDVPQIIFGADGTGSTDRARISTETLGSALDIIGPGGCPNGDCSQKEVRIHNKLVVGGGIVANHIDSKCELKTCDGGDWLECSCPSDKFIHGGGCTSDSPYLMQSNRPLSLTNWQCGGHGGDKHINIICCKIN